MVAAATAVTLLAGACSKGDDAAEQRVVLESSQSAGTDPFTTAVEYHAVPPSTRPAKPARQVSGATPGLYGGTRDKATCNVEQLVAFLTSHTAEGKAWAATQGISVQQMPEYLRSLTPVVLRVDTRVVNHGFRAGKATPRPAVLQAGTAVLVDNRGVPRAKCACGNPLLPAGSTATALQYTGPRWSGFAPDRVTVVTPGRPVDQFTVTDSATGEPFTLPAGSGGRTRDSILGYWSGDWGQMVLRAGPTPQSVIGTYNHDEGTVSGQYDPRTGRFTGWWCESPSRQASADAGDVEFIFTGSGADGRPAHLDGKWRYGTDGQFNEDWDLAPAEGDPPVELIARFGNAGAFCAGG
jgi:hypothetical protein